MDLHTISVEVRHIDENLPPFLSTNWYAKWKVRTVDVTCLSSPEGLPPTLTTEIFLVMVISSFVLQTSLWECLGLRLLKFCKISLQRSQKVDHWSVVLTGREYSPSLYIHLKSEDTKSIILPPFCATSVLERVKSYLFVENISLDYIRKENESITFVQPNLEGYQDWRRIIEFGSYLHTLFCTGSTSLTKINE